ncbi:aspartate carbamoyltransferase catalytic subunit [Sphingobium sp. YG1]|nr:aspartate carbamoyltransferase catalytic subunit [Sphingobium sp. YG1]
MLPVNLVAFTLFAMDKRRARMGLRRFSERTLLLWALIGGTPGAVLGRHVFRHKTRKQPFSTLLWLIAAAQAMTIAAWAMI